MRRASKSHYVHGLIAICDCRKKVGWFQLSCDSMQQSYVAQISPFIQRDFVARRMSHQFCRIVYTPLYTAVSIRGVHTWPEPDPTRKSGSFRLACDYVGSGSGSDFNFRVEIGFKVVVFKFSFGNKLCSMKFQVLKLSLFFLTRNMPTKPNAKLLCGPNTK